MVEEWYISALKGDCVKVIHTLRTEFAEVHKGGKGQDGVEVKSMIDLVLMKKEMLRYVKDVRTVRGMGLDLSDHHVVLCKIRLVGAWIKRIKVVVGARRNISEELREFKKCTMYAGFIDLEGYNWVHREALWQVLRLYDGGGFLCKLLGGIMSKYVDSLACVRVKGGES